MMIATHTSSEILLGSHILWRMGDDGPYIPRTQYALSTHRWDLSSLPDLHLARPALYVYPTQVTPVTDTY
jgi:hypothetical protein